MPDPSSSSVASHAAPAFPEGAAYADLLESVSGLARQLQGLGEAAANQYEPVVDAIIRSRSRDGNHIERTLDGLLDFCGYEPALVLFKRLCRHYWEIDPAATARQINAYRELWDSEETNEPGEPEGRSP
jgi:hypothetical protein